MSQQYAYKYAVIDPSCGDQCIGYDDTTLESTDPNYILIDEWLDGYLFKYYNRANGKWYYDAEFTQEWIPE